MTCRPILPARDCRFRFGWALIPLLAVVSEARSAESGATPQGLASPTCAVVGATVYPVSSRPIADGVVLIRHGRIDKVGARNEVEIPRGCAVIDGRGYSLVPGLVAVASRSVLELIRSPGASAQPYYQIGDELDPFHPLLSVLRREGITTLGLVPSARRNIGGLGLALRLAESGSETPGVTVLKRHTCLALELGKVDASLGPESTTTRDRLEQYYSVRGLFRAAQTYKDRWEEYRDKVVKYNEAVRKWQKRKEAEEETKTEGASNKEGSQAKKTNGTPEKEKGQGGEEQKKDSVETLYPESGSLAEGDEGRKDAKKESGEGQKKKESAELKPPTPPKKPAANEASEVLLRALEGGLPVWIAAHRRDDIEYAIRLKEEFGLKLSILGGTEGYRHADRLGSSEIPVVLGPILLRRHDLRYLNHRESNAAELSKAGVSVSIAGLDRPGLGLRFLRLEAAVAVRGGLSSESALRAMTLAPAERLGVADRIGSLEPGKDADMLLLDGDPVSAMSRVTRVFIAGRTVWAQEMEF